MITRPGYTLIELLMVIAIMGIMATFTFASFRGQDQRRSVEQAATTVVDALKQAQTLALTRTSITGSVKAYVVDFDCSATPCLIKITAEDISGPTPDPAPEEIAIIALPDKIGLTSTGLGYSPVFSSPRGDISFLDGNRNPWSETNLAIRVQYFNDPSNDYCVEINKISGRIDIDQCP